VDVRASISKNHKHAQLPLTRDAADALRCLLRRDATPTDLIFKRLIPRMNRFREDFEAAAIPDVNAKGGGGFPCSPKDIRNLAHDRGNPGVRSHEADASQ
jgi:hypothetical protein